MKQLLIKSFLLISLLFKVTFCFSQDNTELLINSIDSYMQEKHIPGAMISIVRSDTIIFVGGVGFADIDHKEKVSAQHLFRQGSISKSFTALGLYTLLNTSAYSLESPIRTINKNIPFENTWESNTTVNVSHLLEHTSGFEDFHLHAIYNIKDTATPPTINMVNDHQKSLKSRWQPGSKKAYSNPNYIVAGHLIETLSGNSYWKYIEKEVLVPIGMASSGFHFKEPKGKLFAQGYRRTGTTLNPIPFATINGGPAGDFCANATDMATYLQFMLTKDTLLFSQEGFDRIERPKTSIAAKKGLQFGYGLGNYSIWKNGYLFQGHGGDIDGFSARYIYSREADLGIAVAINRNGNSNELVDEILNQLLGEEKPPKNRVTYPIPTALKEKFAGFYEFKSPKSELIAFSDRMLAGLTLDFKEDYLITRTILGKAKDTLFYAGNNQFYLNDEGVPSAVLIEPTEGKLAFWVNDNYTEQESRVRRLVIFFGLPCSVLLLIAFTLYSAVWLLRRNFKKEKSSPINHLTLFGAGLSFILMFLGFGFTMSEPQTSGSINFPSLLMYLSSYAMVIL